MKKSFRVAFRQTKNDSKSIWAIIWYALNFLWVCFITFQVYGGDKTADLITQKVFGVAPFLVSLVGVFVYHYLRSDLYVSQSKPILGRSLITGHLLKMVECWKPEGHGEILVGTSPQCKAYRTLKTYRTSYEYDSIHPEIDEFLSYFRTGGGMITESIKTTFKTKEEAEQVFPHLKKLAKRINKAIT